MLLAMMTWTARAGSVGRPGGKAGNSMNRLGNDIVRGKSDGKKDDGPDEFVDDIAAGLDDASAELLVAGQDAAKVCARDIERYCGTKAMKSKHPIHCLSLLEEDEKQNIHKLCRVHVENSLSITCARDMLSLACDSVVESSLACLSRSLEKVSEDCADQVRMTSHVKLKATSGGDKPIDDAKLLEKVEQRSIKEGWVCGHNFWPVTAYKPCCRWRPDKRVDCDGETEFECAQKKCSESKGQWIPKLGEDQELNGNLCCPPDDAPTDVLEPDTPSMFRDPVVWVFMLGCAAILYWKFDFFVRLSKAIKAVVMEQATEMFIKQAKEVDVPGMPDIQLTEFLDKSDKPKKGSDIFPKKKEKDAPAFEEFGMVETSALKEEPLDLMSSQPEEASLLSSGNEPTSMDFGLGPSSSSQAQETSLDSFFGESSCSGAPDMDIPEFASDSPDFGLGQPSAPEESSKPLISDDFGLG